MGTKKYYKNHFDDITSVPTGISSVPVLWQYYDTEIKLRFTAGFYGFSYSNNALRPEISWVVHEDTVNPQLTKSEKQLLQTYKYGRFYPNSKVCYGVASVVCDSCQKHLAGDDPCIHYNGLWDLCMECVIKVRDTLAKI